MEELRDRHVKVEDKKTTIDAQVGEGEEWAISLYILHDDVLGSEATEAVKATIPPMDSVIPVPACS